MACASVAACTGTGQDRGGSPAASAANPADPARALARLPAAGWADRRRAASDDDAVHLLNRAAFGPRPGDLASLRREGLGAWLDAQLAPATLPMPATLQARLDGLDTLGWSARRLLDAFAATPAGAEGGGTRRALVRRVNAEAVDARLARAIGSPRQLEEVMTAFWFDHFNVFAGKNLTSVLTGHYEEAAIRPHALGRFRALLGATARHPAMLHYLDNELSSVERPADPKRPRRRASGLNENYARELLELHTLGVDGGYTQRDVTELARIFTGWTIDRRGGSEDGFRFDPARHDDGTKQWLGLTIAPAGQAEGERALDHLARHPATARHLAFKLARAFVADRPDEALVEGLAAVFQATDGDIAAVLRALLTSDAFWDPAARRAKFKTPYHYVVSAVRATGELPADVTPLRGALIGLGMGIHACPTPDGYKDTRETWSSADSLGRRIGFAAALASGRGGAARDPVAVAGPALLETLGPQIGDPTRSRLAGRPPGLQALLILGGPDFMVR